MILSNIANGAGVIGYKGRIKGQSLVRIHIQESKDIACNWQAI